MSHAASVTLTGPNPSAPPRRPSIPQLPASTPATTANGVPIAHHSEQVKRYLSEFDSLLLSHSMNKALAMFGGCGDEADEADADADADAEAEADQVLPSCPPSPKPEAGDEPMDIVPTSRPPRLEVFEHKLPTPEPSSPHLSATAAPAVPPSTSSNPSPGTAQVAYRPRLAIGRARAFSAPVPWATPLASPADEIPTAAAPPMVSPSHMSAPAAGPQAESLAPRKRRRSVGDADDADMMAARPAVRRRCALPDIRIPLAVLLAEAKAAQGPEAMM